MSPNVYSIENQIKFAVQQDGSRPFSIGRCFWTTISKPDLQPNHIKCSISFMWFKIILAFNSVPKNLKKREKKWTILLELKQRFEFFKLIALLLLLLITD